MNTSNQKSQLGSSRILLLCNAMMFALIATTNFRRGESLIGVACLVIAVLSVLVFASRRSVAATGGAAESDGK